MDWASFGIGMLAGITLVVVPGVIAMSKIVACVPRWR
jgi:hypothetical protein